MIQLTNEMIIEGISKSSPFMKLELIMFGTMLIVFGILYFVRFKKEQDVRRKRGIIIAIILIVSIFGIPVMKGVFKYNAIQYSIKNNCFEVVIDTVDRTSSSRDDDGDETYYIHLEKNGKVTVSRNTYHSISKGQSVYVVLAKGSLGGKYTTGQIFLTSQYQYIEK